MGVSVTDGHIVVSDSTPVVAATDTVQPVAIVPGGVQVSVGETVTTVIAGQQVEQIALTQAPVAPVAATQTTGTVVLNQQQPAVAVTAAQSNLAISITNMGLQGPPGPPGGQDVYVGTVAPTPVGDQYIWIQTGLGTGTDFTIWFNDPGYPTT